MILVPVLTTSLIHFSWKGWENVLFELGIERVNPRLTPTPKCPWEKWKSVDYFPRNCSSYLPCTWISFLELSEKTLTTFQGIVQATCHVHESVSWNSVKKRWLLSKELSKLPAMYMNQFLETQWKSVVYFPRNCPSYLPCVWISFLELTKRRPECELFWENRAERPTVHRERQGEGGRQERIEVQAFSLDEGHSLRPQQKEHEAGQGHLVKIQKIGVIYHDYNLLNVIARSKWMASFTSLADGRRVKIYTVQYTLRYLVIC